MPPQILSLPRRSGGAVAGGVALAIAATALGLGSLSPAHADPAPPAGAAIPDTGYTLLDVDSESAPYPAPPSLDGTAKGAFDGDYSTQWASDYNGGTPDPMPHYLTFDIGAQHALTGLGYSVKVQGNGPVKNVQVLTTNDADVAKDGKNSGWSLAGTATFSQPTSGTQIQYVAFAQPVSARYVEFKVLDAVNGSNNASASEIVVYTTDPITTPTPTPTPTPKPAAATVTTDSVDDSTWQYPDDTPASPFIDKDGTFHFGESHANYYNEPDGSNGDIRQWNWYTGTDFDTAKPDDALNAAGTNPDTTDFCNASPTGVDSTKAPAGSSYTQPNYCDITQMWVDPDSGDWYGLVHNEFTPQPFGDGLHYDAIDYAVSTDQGRTWTIPGHAITSPYSTTRGDTTAFPQQTYSYGDGDPRLYVDYASGYFYAFYGSRIVNKTGGWVAFYEHVARAPISGKMATGTWQKWYDGTWTQPGISGKESNMVPVADDSETGYTPTDEEYDPNTPGTAQQQIKKGQMPATSPLFVMDVTYDAYLGLYIGQPQNPDQSGNAPQEFYATKNLATQKWFRLGDSGSAYTTASWYRWFVDPANKTSSAIVGKSFRSYCSFGCMGDASAQLANITIDAGPSVSPAAAVDTTKAYTIANADGRKLAVSGDGTALTSADTVDRGHGAWTFAATGDGAYTVATQGGALLGVDASTTAGRAWGAGLTLTDQASAGVGQQWFVVPNTDPASGEATGSIRLVNRYSGLVLGLDDTAAATTPGRTWDATSPTARAAAASSAPFGAASNQVIALSVFDDSTPDPGTTPTPTPTPTPSAGPGSTGSDSGSHGTGTAAGSLASTGGALAVVPAIAAGLLILAGAALALIRRRARTTRS